MREATAMAVTHGTQHAPRARRGHPIPSVSSESYYPSSHPAAPGPVTPAVPPGHLGPHMCPHPPPIDCSPPKPRARPAAARGGIPPVRPPSISPISATLGEGRSAVVRSEVLLLRKWHAWRDTCHHGLGIGEGVHLSETLREVFREECIEHRIHGRV